MLDRTLTTPNMTMQYLFNYLRTCFKQFPGTNIGPNKRKIGLTNLDEHDLEASFGNTHTC